MTLYLNDNSGNQNEIVARMNPAKDRDFCHNLRKYFREYTEVTGIHGLRYVIEKRSRPEKVVWTIILLFSLAGCIYMIYEILNKYENSPVVVSFATEDTPIYDIPFPAVTICPESKYSQNMSIFSYSDVFFKLYKNESVDETKFKYFNHLSLLCDADDEEETGNNFTKTVDGEFYDTIEKLKLDFKELIPICEFGETTFDCSLLFTPILIDEGICYSFNILDRREIFRQHVFQYADYYQVKKSNSEMDYDIENGFKKDAGISTYPRRALQSGADNALTIFFNHTEFNIDYICNKLYQGFRVLIHNPWDVPRLSKHYFRIPFDKVVVAALEPEMVRTSEAVKKFRPEKRKCYFRNERPLQYFQEYSQPNCLFECLTNYTLNRCGCVEFFMPRENDTAICGTASSECLENAEDELRVKELESKIVGKNFCDCKPSCSNIKFNIETSHSDFYFKKYFETRREMVPDGTHWSILQIYFKEEQFMTMERNELYGISDLISNFGGLLGLFTGFSLISLAEIIYFCSLRIFYNEKLYGLWSGPSS